MLSITLLPFGLIRHNVCSYSLFGLLTWAQFHYRHSMIFFRWRPSFDIVRGGLISLAPLILAFRSASSIDFSRFVKIYFNTVTFSLGLRSEPHTEIQCSSHFLLLMWKLQTRLTYPNRCKIFSLCRSYTSKRLTTKLKQMFPSMRMLYIKSTNITKLMQMMFFLYGSYKSKRLTQP